MHNLDEEKTYLLDKHSYDASILKKITEIQIEETNKRATHAFMKVLTPIINYKERIGNIIIQNKFKDIEIKTQILKGYLNNKYNFVNIIHTYNCKYYSFIDKLSKLDSNNIYYDYKNKEYKIKEIIFNKFWFNLKSNHDPILVYQEYYSKYKLFDLRIIKLYYDEVHNKRITTSVNDKIIEKHKNNPNYSKHNMYKGICLIMVGIILFLICHLIAMTVKEYELSETIIIALAFFSLIVAPIIIIFGIVWIYMTRDPGIPNEYFYLKHKEKIKKYFYLAKNNDCDKIIKNQKCHYKPSFLESLAGHLKKEYYYMIPIFPK